MFAGFRPAARPWNEMATMTEIPYPDAPANELHGMIMIVSREVQKRQKLYDLRDRLKPTSTQIVEYELKGMKAVLEYLEEARAMMTLGEVPLHLKKRNYDDGSD